MPGWLRLIVCTGALCLVSWRTSPGSHQDLAPTIIAAHMADAGEWADIYPLPTPEGNAAHGVTWIAKAGKHGIGLGSVGPYTYHPYYMSVARLFASRTPIADISRGLVRLNYFCVAWVAFELVTMLGLSGLAAQLLVTLLLATCSPVISAIDFGQNTIITLALSLTALRFWARGDGPWSLSIGSVLAAFAWACKPWCVLLLPLCFVFRAPRTAALAVAAIVGAMALLPFALFPAVLMEHYTAFLAELSRITIPGLLNLSLLVSLQRFDDPSWLLRFDHYAATPIDASLRYGALALALGFALLAIVAVLRRRPPAVWVSAAGLGLILLPVGVVWMHYFMFALPLAILAAAAEHQSRLLRCAALILLCQLVALEHLMLAEFQRTSPWPPVIPILSVGIVALLALCLGPGLPRTQAQVR